MNMKRVKIQVIAWGKVFIKYITYKYITTNYRKYIIL